jgi:hypothetical protein
MKKLLIQIDTDPIPAVFDTVVGYDGGADHVQAYGGIDPSNVGPLVDGAIFTRAPKEKKFTALFVGGSDMAAGERLLAAIQEKFFASFRVSIMLDSNGSNTTAAAGVACMARSAGGSLARKRAVVLAGTGPVGRRAALMLAREGASVTLTSRTLQRAQDAAAAIERRFGVTVAAVEAADCAARARALDGAQLVFATGAASRLLLEAGHWQDHPTIEILADANATPPLGIEGVDMMDKGNKRGTERIGKACWGAIGFGAVKLALHRACIAQLFESANQVLDADEIYAKAKTMA